LSSFIRTLPFVRSRDGSDTTARMNQNDWALQWFNFAGNSYPIIQNGLDGQSDKESDTDFANFVQNAYKKSGVVYACVMVRAAVFSQARFQYQKMGNGRGGKLFGKPELELLEHPWGATGTTPELLNRMLQDVDMGGNFFAVREGTGSAKKPFRLRRMRPDWVEILLNKPPNESLDCDIVGYVYKPGNDPDPEKWEYFPVDGSNGPVVHWAPIPDPLTQYRGMSWLQSVLVEVMSDKAIATHKQKFFENAATPALAISLSERVTNKQFEAFMERVNKGSAGVANAHKTMYLGGGANVKVVGSDLQQMDFSKIAGHGETRIAMAAGIHPTLIGVAEVMIRGTALNSDNYKTSKSLLIDGHMRGLWASAAAALSVVVPELTNARLWYDDRGIPFLRDDRADVAAIKQTEMSTMVAGIQAGFTPDSVVEAMLMEDWNLLEHTGFYSVQLVPPGTLTAPQAPGASPGADPASPGTGTANTPSPNGKDANTPDSTDKGKSQQPPTPTDDTQ
jgi:phage portal protein BeeE